MQDEIARLMPALLQAIWFEQVATVVLDALLHRAMKALDASSYARQGRILRGMVHLRPEGSYRRFFLRELNEGLSADPAHGVEDASARFLASASAWRAIQQHRCAISIDVNLALFQPHRDGHPAVELPELESAQSAFHGRDSQKRFLGRQTSHVCVLPLRGPGGAIEGMISLEADCAAALGKEFIWRGCGEQLQLIADIASPYFTWLPLQPVDAPAADAFLPVVGAAMANLMPILRVFAQQEETILISGPTGAGKTRLARWCHERSGRSHGPFEMLDLLTVPEELQMAELFGWKRGAFTGAVRDSPGSVARAEGGTLFIDEIDKLSLKAQAGLLHVLESRMYRVLGEGGGERRAHVRFIIGTNASLRAAVRAGHFREDLYYRINILPITIPALDERRDEIVPWGRYMVGRHHRERFPEGQARLAPEAEQRLAMEAWPGNLRQLDNIIRRAYTLSLVDHPSAQSELLVQGKHVAQALSYEVETGSQPVTEMMHGAASAFVHEAQRRGVAAVDLDLTDAFRGYVLGLATRRLGRDEAFRLFGREALLKNRNHHRALRRELEKVEQLHALLGQKASPFADLLNSQE